MIHARHAFGASLASLLILAACNDTRVTKDDCTRWTPHMRELLRAAPARARDRCDEPARIAKIPADKLDGMVEIWKSDATKMEQDFPKDCGARVTQPYTEPESKCFMDAKDGAALTKCAFTSKIFSDMTTRITTFEKRLEDDCTKLTK
jgi:hypothetical protein